MSLTAMKWDLKTKKKIKAMREYFAQSPLPSLSVWQLQSTKEHPADGPVWVSRVIFPPPVDAVRQALYKGIETLSSDGSETFTSPSLIPVKAEWTGYRKGVSLTSPEPDIPEPQKYQNLMKEVTSNVTILYVHGGGYCRGSPSGWRSSVGKLAQLTGGRCISVQYRLAPQNPFPAALLDVFVVYLSLLYPSSRSLHDPVSPSNVVLIGDSCGASLCLSLVKLILELRRQSYSPLAICYGGSRNRNLPLPAGLAAFSAFGVATETLPSWTSNCENDYFCPVPPLPRLPPCDLWPTTPPRAHVYCELNAMCHPLVSPTLVESWVGAPPMWLCCGEEMLVDGSKVIAQRAASDGCTIIWAEYEAMPHCFPFILELPQTEHSFRNCASFCKTCVEKSSSLRSEGTVINTSMQTRSVDIGSLIELSFGEVKKRAQHEMKRQIEEFSERSHVQPKL